MEHALFDAAFLDEAVLHGLQQTLEHVVGLVDEGDAQVGYLLVVHLLNLAGIVFLYLLAAGILAHGVVAWVELAPLLQASHAKIIFIIVEQFLQAGLRHIGELDFRLARGGGGLVALSDVLLARASRLHHLVDGSVTFLQEPLAEVEGDVVDHLRHLIDPQIAIMPMLRKEDELLRTLRTLRILRTLSILKTLSIQITLIILIH